MLPKSSLQKGAKEDADPLKPDNQAQKISGKGSVMRQLNKLKGLMDKRLEQRIQTIHHFSHNKQQSAQISCRQLMFSSTKVYREYLDEYNEVFEMNFFYRTSKSKEHIEYLLDSVIACKVFQQAKKKDETIDILDKIELMDELPHSLKGVDTPQQKLKLNDIHEIHSKRCAALLTLIEISIIEKLEFYCQKFYQQYLRYVRKYYGMIEFSTALFKYANYLFQTKKYAEAEKHYKICVDIRKKNVVNSCLVDSLINLAICQRELRKYKEALANTKEALQTHKDVSESEQSRDQYYLFLGKLHLQSGEFQQAYSNFLICYKFRSKFDLTHPGRIQIELNFIFFHKILMQIIARGKDMMNTDDRRLIEETRHKAEIMEKIVRENLLERKEFVKYQNYKESKLSHLTINNSKQFFTLLNAYQVNELHNLIGRLNDLTYARGLSELYRCSFYEDKNLRELFLQANPLLQKKPAKPKGETGKIEKKTTSFS